MLDRSPATNARSRSASRPSLVHRSPRSKPDAWPAPLSAARMSTLPDGPDHAAGRGAAVERQARQHRTLPRYRASARPVQPAFSFEIDPTPARHPARRSGPTRCAKSSTATIRLTWRFFSRGREGSPGAPARHEGTPRHTAAASTASRPAGDRLALPAHAATSAPQRRPDPSATCPPVAPRQTVAALRFARSRSRRRFCACPVCGPLLCDAGVRHGLTV